MLRAAIVTALAATVAMAAQDPAVQQAAADAAAQAAPAEPGFMREWGARLVEYGPAAIFVAFVISGIGLHLDQPVDLGGLFKSADAGLESNINTVETKQKSGGGIAANLARLKKLKGGG